jgi:hypothetical protein
MLQEFLRLAVYVSIGEADDGPGLVVASAAAVQEILRVFREFDFAGSVGTYQAAARRKTTTMSHRCCPGSNDVPSESADGHA